MHMHYTAGCSQTCCHYGASFYKGVTVSHYTWRWPPSFIPHNSGFCSTRGTIRAFGSVSNTSQVPSVLADASQTDKGLGRCKQTLRNFHTCFPNTSGWWARNTSPFDSQPCTNQGRPLQKYAVCIFSLGGLASLLFTVHLAAHIETHIWTFIPSFSKRGSMTRATDVYSE